MIEAEIFQLERSAAELDRAAGIADDLIGERRVRILEHGEALLGPPMSDDGGAGVLERLAAGDVIVVVVAVDQELDRLVGHLLDLGNVVLAAGRPAVGDRIGRDHPVLGDDEHRLVVAVAEYVDVVGAVDLGGLDLRPLCLLRQPRCCETGDAQRDRHGCEPYLRHDDSSLTLRGPRRPFPRRRPAASYSTGVNEIPRIGRLDAALTEGWGGRPAPPSVWRCKIAIQRPDRYARPL